MKHLNLASYFIPTLTASCYFVLGIFYLYRGFPAEDALILFRYSENLAETSQITFNLGGERAEGATDFLWMLLIAFLKKIINLDVAIGAQLLNSLGVGGITYLIWKPLRFNTEVMNTSQKCLVLSIILNVLLASNLAFSSYLGFSVLAYLSIGFYVYYFAFNNRLKLWVISSVIFILFRPEAVIFWIGSFLFLLQENRLNRNRIHLFKYTFFVIFSGLLYFFFRLNYFGNLLPLPLYVKQIGKGSFLVNLLDSANAVGTVFIIFILFIMASLKKIISNINRKFISIFLFFLISIVAYIITLNTGHKSQNIYHRYEAPLLFLLFLSFILIVQKNSVRPSFNYIFSLFFIMIGFFSANQFFITNKGADHFTRVGLLIGQEVKDLKIALTEAGNIPFWSKSIIYDLAGLNTKFTAKSPISCNQLNEFNPDLIEIDIQENYFLNRLHFFKDNEECLFVDNKDFFDNFSKKNSEYIVEYNPKGSPTTFVATINTLFCINKNELNGKFNHVFMTRRRDQIYFINEKSIHYDTLFQILTKSCAHYNSGYLIAKKQLLK